MPAESDGERGTRLPIIEPGEIRSCFISTRTTMGMASGNQARDRAIYLWYFHHISTIPSASCTRKSSRFISHPAGRSM